MSEFSFWADCLAVRVAVPFTPSAASHASSSASTLISRFIKKTNRSPISFHVPSRLADLTLLPPFCCAMVTRVFALSQIAAERRIAVKLRYLVILTSLTANPEHSSNHAQQFDERERATHQSPHEKWALAFIPHCGELWQICNAVGHLASDVDL